MLDLEGEVQALWEPLNAAIQRVLRSGHFILGPEVQALESELAGFLGVKHAIALNSGTDALVIGLRALGIGSGDEVITTPFSFFATAEAVTLLGAKPVFVDIDPATYNLDPGLIEAAVTPRTKAIIPVHLFGHSADLDAIRRVAKPHGLRILEDTAQGFGGRYRGQMLGTFGEMGAFSFFPTKNLGAYGDAGMLATNDDALAETARLLRAHGSKRKYFNEVAGYNSRLDALQAAILRVKLPHVPSWNAARREAAGRYTQLLQGAPGIVTPKCAEYAEHAYHQYTIRVGGGRRDEVQRRLAARGVASMVYYPVPLHRLPIYLSAGLSLPRAEEAAREVLSLPLWPAISAEVQAEVVAALRAGP